MAVRAESTTSGIYPSGSIAVCQSCSCPPHGGFCTNVFADTQHPVTLMTISPFGHGAVTNPLYSTITAVWDQGGGLMFDDYGNITKEWSWQTYHTLRGEIIIQTENKLFSVAAQELQQPKRQKHPAGVPESKRSLGKTLMVKEEEQQVEPLALWRRRGNAARELQRMQQRMRNTVETWLDCYRTAIGIKCPDTEPLPGAQKWTRQRRAVQLAALPSLNSPECKKAAQLHAGRRRRDELRENHRGLSAEKPRGRFVQIQRTLEKQGRNTSPVTQIGPLRIHGDIKPESVILSHPAGSEASPICSQTAMVPLAPSIPLTTCPALLRAALQGEERQRRRCCCSATQMPVVTDLEYDAFITGQPLHSKQILVVCVTPRQQPVNKHAATRWDALDDLYRRRNKRRTMPCTECQMDSFRLVRYEMSAGLAGSGPENVLLQQRHDAAPGMFLMYLNGKLLFSSHLFSDDSFSVKDLQTQICRSRKEHRLGLSLPTDQNSRYHCRDWVTGADVSVETPRLPLPQKPPPALLGEARGSPHASRPTLSLQRILIILWASSWWNVPGKTS
ncbi:PREDICTED: uncharacterized protein C3orf20 homolog [Cyprinodon variegatus]|uniref:uncharacterized protein C3orf20 homolog n=1 Tax=Cyprinodon variegatus TaxID=28743 RepID=UPI0007429EF4|nr:PREDICTED: uncharacterized protein C3orf20 homolog [Cyprinodon variegatus]